MGGTGLGEGLGVGVAVALGEAMDEAEAAGEGLVAAAGEGPGGAGGVPPLQPARATAAIRTSPFTGRPPRRRRRRCRAAPACRAACPWGCRRRSCESGRCRG